MVRVNDPSNLCVARSETTERTSLSAVGVDDVELSSTKDRLEVSERRSVVCEGNLTA
jgi:hypothetical protein